MNERARFTKGELDEALERLEHAKRLEELEKFERFAKLEHFNILHDIVDNPKEVEGLNIELTRQEATEALKKEYGHKDS